MRKCLEEKLYRCCIREIRKIEASSKRNILLAIDNIAELPALKEFNPKENTLLIVDDFVADDPKSLKPLNEIWLRGRKNSISPLFISQSYFDTPKIIRKKSDYVFVKAIGNPMDMSRIAKEYALGVTPKEITALYTKTQRGNLEDFFLVDRFNQDLRHRFRDGFEPFEE